MVEVQPCGCKAEQQRKWCWGEWEAVQDELLQQEHLPRWGSISMGCCCGRCSLSQTAGRRREGKKQTVHCTVQCLPSWGSPAHPPGLYHLAPVAGTLEAVHQLQLGLHSLRVLWPWQGSQEIVKQWASQPSAATQLWQLWIDWFDIVNSFPHD